MLINYSGVVQWCRKLLLMEMSKNILVLVIVFSRFMNPIAGSRELAESFLEFISAANNLQEIRINECHYFWSQSLFISLACIPTLNCFSINNTKTPIDDGWILKFAGQIPDAFKNLKILDVQVTAAAVILLIPHLESIEDLKLFIHPSGMKSMNHILTEVGNLPKLQRLTIDFGFMDWLRGSALEAVASGCPELTTFSISDRGQSSCWPVFIAVSSSQTIYRYSREISQDPVTDSTIEAFAKLLPGLKSFELRTGHSKMTESSVLHLGRNCRHLQTIKMTASTINLLKLAHHGSHEQFVCLKELHPHSQGSGEDSQNLASELDFWMAVKRFVSMLPNVVSLNLPSLQSVGRYYRVFDLRGGIWQALYGELIEAEQLRFEVSSMQTLKSLFSI